MEQPNHILVVDDDDMTRLLMKTILSRMSYQVSEAVDGIDAWEKVPVLCPDLIILDVSMPRMDGLELTYKLKNEPNTKNIPIMIVSNHDEITDQVKAVEAGADDFLPKPVEQIILKAKVTSLLKIKSYNDYMQSYQIKLEDEVAKKTAKLKYAFDELETANKRLKLYSLDTILRLSQAAEYKDQQTGQHIQRIGYYIQIIGQKISLSPNEIDEFLYASPMHDVGKIGIPDNILLKPGKLNAEEWAVMQQHTTIGGKILSGSDSSTLKTAEIIALTHHEKWDGSGYPNNLKGSDIPMPGRITAIADVFDALTSKRPYKDAFSMEKAFAIMKDGQGKHFDPDLLDAFFVVKDDIIAIRNKY
ncbi:MAG: response regulator [Desulfobacula sp.]|jgi:putative two-component system response regulator|nr:response regulator [Desulfobacula sp.]MBT6338603.1 response regulator [Desulfobacula sp.]